MCMTGGRGGLSSEDVKLQFHMQRKQILSVHEDK